MNYYAGRGEGWSNQWSDFDKLRPRIISDLVLARQLGVTSIRTFVMWSQIGAECDKTFLDRLDAFLTIATTNGIRTIVGFDGMEVVSTSNATRYISCLAKRFGNDTRIWMWDLVNEPDGRSGWTSDCKFTPGAISFLKTTYAALAGSTYQQVTVGCVIGWNLLQDLCSMFPDDRFVPQMHVYPQFTPSDPGPYQSNIVDGSVTTFQYCGSRALFLGEWGRPGHDTTNTSACLDPEAGVCNEANQQALYEVFVHAVNPLILNGTVLAVAPWTLNEFTQKTADPTAEREAYFGIVRSDTDYSLKPAAKTLQAWYTKQDAQFV